MQPTVGLAAVDREHPRGLADERAGGAAHQKGAPQDFFAATVTFI